MEVVSVSVAESEYICLFHSDFVFFFFFFFLFQLDSMLHVPVLQACMFPVYEHSHAAVNRTDLVVVGSLAFLLSERVL